MLYKKASKIEKYYYVSQGRYQNVLHKKVSRIMASVIMIHFIEEG